MTNREFNWLLDDKSTVEEFKASIAAEVENYERLMKKIGSTIDLPLYEDEEINMDRFKFRKLLNYVISGQLSNIQLAFICDCLTLSSKLMIDRKTKTLIFKIADPEINGGFMDKAALIDMVSKIS